MTESKADLVAHFRAMRTDLLGAIEGLTLAQASETTIDGWSVKDHLGHIALWDELRAAEVLRISAGHDSAWRMSPEQEAAFSGSGYELRRTLSWKQALWEIESTHVRLLEAIQATTPHGLDASLYGEAALPSTHERQHTDWIRRWRRERGY